MEDLLKRNAIYTESPIPVNPARSQREITAEHARIAERKADSMSKRGLQGERERQIEKNGNGSAVAAVPPFGLARGSQPRALAGRHPECARGKWRKLALFRRAKTAISHVPRRVSSMQLINFAAVMSTDFFGGW